MELAPIAEAPPVLACFQHARLQLSESNDACINAEREQARTPSACTAAIKREQ